MRTTFDELWDHWTWRPIRNCPGRFVLSRPDYLISFEILLGYSCFPQRYNSPMAKDPVSVISLENGGLISYQQPNGRLIHTLNTPEGFARKLRQLQIPLPTTTAAQPIGSQEKPHLTTTKGL